MLAATVRRLARRASGLGRAHLPLVHLAYAFALARGGPLRAPCGLPPPADPAGPMC